MAAIQEQWPEVKEALRLTAELLGTMGYSGMRLSSNNASIPIAYFIRKVGSPRTFSSDAKWEPQRRAIRRWLGEALIRGVFSGHSDAKLKDVRDVVRERGGSFPADEIMTRLKLPPLTDDDFSRFLI